MGPVDDQKRELCKQAYLLICKYCAAAGKEGKEACDFRNTIRKPQALDIDKETNKALVAELTKFKQQGGIAALLAAGGSSQPTYGGGGAKAARSKGGGGSGSGGAGGLPPGGGGRVPGPGASAGGAKPSRSAATKGGGKADGGSGGSLPASLDRKIGMKVNRWWAREGQWFSAVITDYNSETNEYRLTYNLGLSDESYEDLNLDLADPAVFALTGERVDLLAKTGSAAVNNSRVLKPFLKKAAAGAGGGGSGTGGGGGGGSKTSKSKPKPSKKRRSSISSDYDNNDDSDYEL